MLSDPWNSKLEPAPISPYKNSPASRILSGTIKATYNAHRGLEGDDNIMVYPSYLFGNTGKGSDSIPSFGERGHELLMQILNSTGSYRKIFTGTTTMISIREMGLVGSIPSTKVRCVPHLLPLFTVLIGALVDIRADSLLEMIKFFVALILNTDEAADL